MRLKTTNQKSASDSTESFRLLYENYPLPMWIYDLKTLAFLDVNEATLEKYGYSRAEFLKMTLKDIRPAEDAKKKRPALQRSGEWRHRLKDGRIIEVEINSHAVEYNGREAALVTAQDISERKRAEETLRALSSRQEAILAAVPDILMEVDQDKVYTWANPAGIMFFGEDVIGKEAAFYFEGEQTTYDVVNPLFNGSENVIYIESWQRRKDGEKRLLAWWCHVLKNTDGNVVGAISLAHDVTERKKAEELQQETLTRLLALVENVEQGILFEDENRLIRFLNNKFCALFGLPSPQAMMNADCRALAMQAKDYFTDPAGFLRGIDDRLSRREVALSDELTLLDGRVLERDYIPVKIGEKQSGNYWIYRDITERKQAEEKLRESEARFRGYFELPLVGFAISSPNAQWLDANPTLCDMLGYTKDELLQKTWKEITHPDDIPANMEKFNQALRGEVDNYSLEKRFIRKDGSIIHVDMAVHYLRHPDRTIDYLMSLFLDITERKQAEKKLTDSEAELRALFASMQDVVLVIDRAGIYRKIAPTNPALLVKPPEELLGKNLRDIFPAEQAETFLVAMQQVLETQQSVRIEYELLIGKHPTWFATSISPMDAENTVWVARDITERKQAEEKIRQMNTELEQRVEERTHELREAQEKLVRQEKLAVLGQLAGGVGHELRNPLAVINNAAYYLKLVQPDADGKIKEYLNLIERETRTAEKIISDLLDFSRVTTADREAVSVSDLVHQTLERFPVPDSVEVTLKIPDDLPPIFVDVRQMEQVLGNLTVNACQAMPSGGKLSVISRQSSVKSDALLTDNWILITVQDTGIGIPPENMKKLFEPLFTTKAKGIGLGLAVSKKLAEANGGRIEVQSEAGVGSTFTLYLPAQDEEG